MQNRLGSFILCFAIGLFCTNGVSAQVAENPGIPLKINEIMAANVTGETDAQGDYDDWVELHNAGDDPLDVGGMYMTDDLDEPAMWQIPVGDPSLTTIAPHGFLIIWMDNDITASGLHAGFKLNASGESLAVFATDGISLVDEIEFGNQRPDFAYGRYPDGTDQWRFLAFPSPENENLGLYLGFAEDTKFSVDRGLYDEPFSLVISTDTPEAVILYTLDGSEPEVADFSHPTGIVYDGPILIDRTTCVRALAYLPGWMASNVDTQTYIFLEDVIRQPDSPAGFPSRWGSTQADYEMDPEVVDDPRYQDQIIQSLQSLPSLSLVMDTDDMFGGNGIYTHSTSSGLAWERAGSSELIYPDGQEGFQIDCGIRIQGGWFRSHSGTRKHSFRLLFKTMYGRSKLSFPLFGEGAVDEFDTITLRAGANDGYAWSSAKYTEQYTRDAFGRSLQRDTGQAGAHSMFVHLYVNGLYWGLYNPTERPDNAFSASYYGGDKEDWDAMHDGRASYGSTAAWTQMLGKAQEAGASFAAYQALQGRNAQGLPDPSLPHWLDVTNYVDYLIVNLWGGNWDWPWKNWWAGRLRTSNSTGFKFYCWDFENTMGNNRGRSPLNKNALNNNFSSAGQPHQRLQGNPEYQLHFADRIHRLFFNESVLTPPSLIMRYADLADQVEAAMIAESARWGDQHHRTALTQAEWFDERSWLLNDYLPQRSEVVLQQFRDAGLYPNLEAPVFAINGQTQYGGHVSGAGLLSMQASEGEIWYTLDGSDPRVPGTGGSTVDYATLVPENAAKRVLIPSGPVSADWRADPDFDDTHWQFGIGGVGYERNNGYQALFAIDASDMYQGNTSCLLRIPFQTTRHIREFSIMTLNVRYDDGFVAYINGQEVARSNAPQSLQWDSSATQQNSDGAAVQLQRFDISTHLEMLQQGDNVLALHGLNIGRSSSDFLLSAELLAAASSPQSEVGIAPQALAYTDPLQLSQTSQVRARTLRGGIWSALNEALFSVGPIAESLRITELMYHPELTGSPNDPNTEYVELANIGLGVLHLNGVRFTQGIEFVFPELSLGPNERLVLVRDEMAFAEKYGAEMFVGGQYQGKLSNGGERIELQDAVGTVIHDFRFQDNWHDLTDGQGHSLVIVDVLADPDTWMEKDAWQVSLQKHGTPGTE
jgi:hypothetical protein